MTFPSSSSAGDQHIANTIFAAIVMSSEDAIISKSLDGRILSWNGAAETLFGYTADEMIGQPITRLFPPENLQEETDLIARIERGEIVKSFETARVRKDGSRIEVSVTISPIRDASGKIIGASKIARDVSERLREEERKRLLERRLVEAAKLESLGILAGGIAHDFNNLLTGILGNASLARHALPASSPGAPLLNEIEVAARRAADLCKQMLAYAGKGRFQLQDLDLNEIVEDTSRLLRVSISKKCELNLNLAQQLPSIHGDATQVRQVLMNLIINGSDALGDRSGHLVLTTGLTRVGADQLHQFHPAAAPGAGDHVYVEVRDNGCGMDAATLGRSFDPFFTTKFAGRGLGLAAVLGIVRSHKGGLSVYSEPGKGTTVKVFFPANAGEIPRTRIRLDDRELRGSGTILVVDDEESVRTIAARVLESFGFEIVCARDGREGLDLYRREPGRYCLVLLDLTMPHLDGEEVFRHMQAINPRVQVLLTSGFSEIDTVKRFTGKGLAGFVPKPFDLPTLRKLVGEALRQGGAKEH